MITSAARVIVSNDAKQFKNQHHPEYSANPRDEIRQSLNLLRNKPIWKERYQAFIETMVYGSTNTLDYETAIVAIEQMSEKVMDWS